MRVYLKRILIGSGLAFVFFLAIIFLFGDQHTISVTSPLLVAKQRAAQLPPPLPADNLTESFGKSLAAAILNANPDGPQTADGQLTINVKDPHAFIQQTLAKEMGSFDPLDLDPIVDSSKFTTVKTEPASIAAYFKNFGSLFDARLFDAPTDPNTNIQEYFNTLLGQTDQAYSKLFSLPVPTDLVNIHLQALTILGRQRNIVALVKNSDTDPLRALMALQTATNFQDDMQALKQSIEAYRGMAHP